MSYTLPTPVLLRDRWIEQRKREHFLYTFHHHPFVHVYQHALDSIHPRFFLGQMYEDTRLEMRRFVENLYRFLLTYQPNSFMLIEAGGDKVDPSCKAVRQEPGTHLYCTTYDPITAFYLLPIAVWEKEQETILQKDVAWYCHAMICRDQKG